MAVSILAFFALCLEWRLAERGFRPTITDTYAIWAQQRERAVTLGRNALVIVGASRAQLDLDLATLREDTGLEPVQLAIDGSSFLPILKGLSRDPAITGTILVDYQTSDLADEKPSDVGESYERQWEDSPRLYGFQFSKIEGWLTSSLRQQMRSYANGATPLSSIRQRVLESTATVQYLWTSSDRSRQADYQRVGMPSFYYRRVIRELEAAGVKIDLPDRTKLVDVPTLLQQSVEKILPAPVSLFSRNLDAIDTATRTIQERGGRVIFVALPTSGYVRQIIERRYPRELFWDVFAARVGQRAVDVEALPGFSSFECPDGSHLDYRDRVDFTHRLASVLFLRQDH